MHHCRYHIPNTTDGAHTTTTKKTHIESMIRENEPAAGWGNKETNIKLQRCK
jgi:hypothetical protein